MDKHKADAREARGISWVDDCFQDVRYGVRTLRKNPGYALLAILTLGLGIGANTAIFSVINGVLLKPLPYEHGDRLVLVRQSAPLAASATPGVAIAEYFDYREQARRVRRPGRVPPDEFRPAESRRARSRQHRRRLRQLLRRARHQAGPRPHLRRRRRRRRAPRRCWCSATPTGRTKFGGDPNIIGQVFEMNDRPHTRRRRAAERAALPAGERRLHAGAGVPVPRRRGAAIHAQPPRLRGAERVRPAEAGRHARAGRRRRRHASASASPPTTPASIAPAARASRPRRLTSARR